MSYRVIFHALCASLLLALCAPAAAQDALLPADLFFLDSVGQVWRFAADGSALDAILPDGVAAVGFALSPGGDAIIYRTAEGAVARTLPGADVVTIDAEAGVPEAGAPGAVLAWSPSGVPIAYTAGAGVRVYLPEGDVRLEADGGPFVDLLWSPGGRYLACKRAGDGWMIFRLDLAALTLAGTLEGDDALAWTRDETLVVAPEGGGLHLVRLGAGVQTLVEGDAYISKPVVRGGVLYYFVHTQGPQSPGVLMRLSLTPGAMPETVGTLAFDPGASRWVDGALLLTLREDAALVLIDPITGETTPIPNTAGASAWAWYEAAPLPLADTVVGLPEDLYFLAASADVVQVWRVAQQTGTPLPLTAEIDDVTDFTLSSDGNHLAYTVGGRLMLATIGAADARQLAGGGGDMTPAFRADGLALAYADGGILTVPSDGGDPVAVLGDPADRRYTHPRWSPDGTWLLIDIESAEGVEVALLSVTGRGPLTLDVRCGGARWMAGNKFLCWGAHSSGAVTPGLYVVTPGDPPRVTLLLDESWSLLDAVHIPKDGTIFFVMGSTMPGMFAAQPMRLAPGAVPEPSGLGGMIDAPRLAPDGSMLAGRDGTGRLMFIRTETGECTILKAPARAWGLVWGNGDAH